MALENRSTLEEADSVKPLLFLRAKHYLINAYRKVINSPVYEDYMDYLDHHKQHHCRQPVGV